MTRRTFYLAMLSLAITSAVLLTRHFRRHFDALPPDDGPPILWVDDHMGEPWVVLYQRERVA